MQFSCDGSRYEFLTYSYPIWYVVEYISQSSLVFVWFWEILAFCSYSIALYPFSLFLLLVFLLDYARPMASVAYSYRFLFDFVCFYHYYGNILVSATICIFLFVFLSVAMCFSIHKISFTYNLCLYLSWRWEF